MKSLVIKNITILVPSFGTTSVFARAKTVCMHLFITKKKHTMKMITALLKASFLVVLSMLLFNTASLAQSKAADQQTQETKESIFLEELQAQGITYEKASSDLAIWQQAKSNLPTQGAGFTPEQYQMAENWILQNLAVTQQQVNALKPTITSTTE